MATIKIVRNTVTLGSWLGRGGFGSMTRAEAASVVQRAVSSVVGMERTAAVIAAFGASNTDLQAKLLQRQKITDTQIDAIKAAFEQEYNNFVQRTSNGTIQVSFLRS